jgi:hypothetical protein
VTRTLERAEPELAADLVDNGICARRRRRAAARLDVVLANATGLDVRIADDPLTCVARGTAIYLENLEEWKATMESGEGVFIADVERDRAFVGDIVRLNDPGWSPVAQGMILGTIESVTPNDDEPLRRRIVVRPQYAISDVAVVTLIVAGDAEPDDAGGGEGRP